MKDTSEMTPGQEHELETQVRRSVACDLNPWFWISGEDKIDFDALAASMREVFPHDVDVDPFLRNLQIRRPDTMKTYLTDSYTNDPTARRLLNGLWDVRKAPLRYLSQLIQQKTSPQERNRKLNQLSALLRAYDGFAYDEFRRTLPGVAEIEEAFIENLWAQIVAVVRPSDP